MSVSSSPLYSHTPLLPSKVYSPSPTLSLSAFRSSFQLPTPRRSSSPALLRSFSTHRRLLPYAVNFPSGNLCDPANIPTLNCITSLVHRLFDDLPQHVKRFPWAKVLESFSRLVFDLSCQVGKYLSVPVLAVSSLSEMSYCGHERKLIFVPFPFLIGFVLAGVLADTAIELSVNIKEGELPWHLLLVTAFFLLLKLPGPYYPYWGRLIVPHFANGGLWRMVWRIFMWFRGVDRTRVQSGPSVGDSSL